MSPTIVIITIASYIALLFVVAWLSGRNADNSDFFTGGRRSPWVVAMLGMVSAAMSGVTFISVPGSVAASGFSYLQMVAGFIVGYLVIAFVLVPLYYRLNVTSLYEYLGMRFGRHSHKVGAAIFLLSRTLLTALRAYVVCTVLQIAIFDHYDIPFFVNAVLFVLLTQLYTHRGGVRTIVWTDTLRTLSLVGSLVLCIALIMRSEGLSFGESVTSIADHPYSRIWFAEDWNDSRHFAKQFIAGVFMVVAMTGLDQDMMQRTLSCRSKNEAQRNLIVAVMLQAVVIVLFLALGVLLYIYLENAGIRAHEDSLFPMFTADGAVAIAKADHVFPFVATSGLLPISIGVLFILGLISSTYSATGSAMTALTTSFTIDILRGQERFDEGTLRRMRNVVNIGVAVVLTTLIIIFDAVSNETILDTFYAVASYTYGPLLGIFAFGILSHRAIRDRLMVVVVIAAPLLCLMLDTYSAEWFGGYHFGFEILIINALLTMAGLYAISKTTNENNNL